MGKILYLVVPCYNEATVLVSSWNKLEDKLKRLINQDKIARSSKIVFVDDGSRDDSWKIIQDICLSSSYCIGVKLSTNRGQQIALLEGIRYSCKKADLVITVDCDLQDDIEVIDEMVQKYNQGNEIVYGVHSCRKKDSIFKRIGAYCFYKILPLFNINLHENHSEYRLMSRAVMEDIVRHGQNWLPIRCFVSTLSYPSAVVSYSRQARLSGKTKYSFWSLMSLAWGIIIGFSVKPVELILILGAILTFVGCLGGGLIGLGFWNIGVEYRSYTLLGCIFLATAGVVVFCLGVVGSYLTKILELVRKSPGSYEVDTTDEDSSRKVKLLNNIL